MSAIVVPEDPGVRPVWPIALVVALIGTIAFYLPLTAAFQEGNANWPGFMLAHDQRVFYFPSFVEGYRRFWSGGLLGIDFFTSGGASVFAFRPNLLPFYPPYLLAYLLVDCSDPRTGMLAYVAIHIAHQFAGLFFTVVFVRRYLGFPVGAAILAASLFALSYQSSVYVVFATFYFQMMLIPISACTLCWLMRSRSRLAPVLASPVFLTFALTNYGPTMLISMGISVMAALTAFVTWTDRRRHLRDLAAPAVSLGIAIVAVVPYFYGQLAFKRVMAPTADDLQQVAYDLAFSGYDLFNGLSQFIHIKRAATEGALVWGLIPVFLAFAGVEVLLSRRTEFRPNLTRACAASLAVYLPILLASLGTSMVSASNAFFYAAPIVGKMHIFQRYLIYAQFPLAIAIAALAAIVVVHATLRQKRRIAYAGLGLWLGVTAVFMLLPPSPADYAIPELMVELFLLAIAAVTLACLSGRHALVVIAAICSLSGLHSIYTQANEFNKPKYLGIEPSLLRTEIPAMLDFMIANRHGKALPHLLSADPEIQNYLNRNLPWLIGERVPVVNFQGYPPHLSILAGYASQWADYRRYDADWLRAVGLDFVYWTDGKKDALDPILKAGFKIGSTLPLPGGHNLSEVTYDEPAARVLDLSADNPSWPEPFALDGWAVEAGRLVKVPGGVENHFGYPVPETIGEAYDIRFDIAAGSRGRLMVAFGNAVVQEIDVGAIRQFSARVAPSQAGDLWITALGDFSGSLSNIVIRSADAAARRYDNGIVRVDAAPGTVSGFETNYSNFVRMVVDAPAPTKVAYVLWPNPYMVPYVDGRRADWSDPASRPVSIEMPAGRHTLEIKFRSGAATAFRLTMGAFSMALVAAVAWSLAVRFGAVGRPNVLPGTAGAVLSGGRDRRTRFWELGRAFQTRLDVVRWLPALRVALRERPASAIALCLLLATLVLTLLVNFGIAEILTSNRWGLPYVGELPSLRGNDLTRLMEASKDFAPQIGADRVMPGEPVPYPPFAFLVFGLLAALPSGLAWTMFYLPALLQVGIAARIARIAATPPLRALWFVAILLAYPFLYVLDRANVDLYTGILCFGGLMLLVRGQARAAAVAIGLAAALKIYPVVLFCLLVRRDRKALVIGVGVAALCTILALLVFRQGPLEMLQFLRANLARTADCFRDETRCLNLSLAVPFKIAFAGLVTFDWYPSLWEWSYRAYGIVSLLLGVSAAVFVALRPSRIWVDALRLTLVMTLLPVMSYDYKLMLFLGPMALALGDMRTGPADRGRDAALVLMAVLLSSWKWLGQWPHLWIHAGAQILLVGVAVLASRPILAGVLERRGRWRPRILAGAGALATALVAWSAFGNDLARRTWAGTTSWCPAQLVYGETDPFPIWGGGWGSFEGSGDNHWRWTTDREAELYLPLKGRTAISGIVALPPGSPDGTIAIQSSQGGSARVAVPAGAAVPFTLDAGESGLARIEFEAPGLRELDGRDLGLVVSGLRASGECR